MRILFLLTQDLKSPSGLGRYWPMARELASRGHTVRITALHPDFNTLDSHHMVLDGVEVHYVAPMHVMKSADQKSYYQPLQLVRVVLKATLALSWGALRSRFDMIYIGKPHPMNGIAGLLVKVFRRTPLVVDCDDYEAGLGHFSGQWQRKLIEFFEKRVPRLATAVTTHTHFMRDNLINWGVSPENITYIPNGVDPKRFPHPDPSKCQVERKRLALEGKKVISYIGSLSMPSHPVHLLIDAFAQIQKDFNDTVLLIVGGGEEKPNLQKQAADLGLLENCRFVGRVPPEDIAQYYALADVSIDPIYDDPAARGRSPLKLFESWISEVPFVSADVGERSYLMGDPPAGILVSPNQDGALARGITKVLSDADFAKSLSDLGKERVKNYFWSALVQNLEDLFTALLNLN